MQHRLDQEIKEQGIMETTTLTRPANLKQLLDSGWESRSVKQEIRDNFLRKLAAGEPLYPGI
ncbi:MAG: hypothetical protein VYE64_03015, partial [Planctomycetota bacterium]|nr:hypothetical protein [Planctomycetota bacterium]